MNNLDSHVQYCWAVPPRHQVPRKAKKAWRNRIVRDLARYYMQNRFELCRVPKYRLWYKKSTGGWTLRWMGA